MAKTTGTAAWMIKYNIDALFMDNFVCIGMYLGDEVCNFLQARTVHCSVCLLVHEDEKHVYNNVAFLAETL